LTNNPVASKAASLRLARALFWLYSNVTLHMMVVF
jgi:hypothetical protein